MWRQNVHLLLVSCSKCLSWSSKAWHSSHCPCCWVRLRAYERVFFPIWISARPTPRTHPCLERKLELEPLRLNETPLLLFPEWDEFVLASLSLLFLTFSLLLCLLSCSDRIVTTMLCSLSSPYQSSQFYIITCDSNALRKHFPPSEHSEPTLDSKIILKSLYRWVRSNSERSVLDGLVSQSRPA